MTIEYVGDSLPPINREGSGRNNEFFTDEVLSKLRNDKGNWCK